VTLTHWKKEFIEKGPEIFSQQTTIQEYEKRIEDLERLIGHKEVEIALLKETGLQINLVAGLTEIGDFEVVYTDFTEILYRRGRAKAQLMPLVDHSSKLVVGHALGEADNTWTPGARRRRRFEDTDGKRKG
jgi:hypothetical protein